MEIGSVYCSQYHVSVNFPTDTWTMALSDVTTWGSWVKDRWEFFVLTTFQTFLNSERISKWKNTWLQNLNSKYAAGGNDNVFRCLYPSLDFTGTYRSKLSKFRLKEHLRIVHFTSKDKTYWALVNNMHFGDSIQMSAIYFLNRSEKERARGYSDVQLGRDEKAKCQG